MKLLNGIALDVMKDDVLPEGSKVILQTVLGVTGVITLPKC
jgi:hypothetical protein